MKAGRRGSVAAEAPGEGSKRHYKGFEQQRIGEWKKFLMSIEVKFIEDHCRREMRWCGYEATGPKLVDHS